MLDGGLPTEAGSPKSRDGASAKEGASSTSTRRRLLRASLAVAVVAAVFVGIVPRIADYEEVARIIGRVGFAELSLLVAVTTVNLLTYWPQMVAALPGLRLSQAAVVNVSSTAVANTVPAGGAVAVAVTYAMCRSWGFANQAIALAVLLTGLWNVLLKLALPVVALAVLAFEKEVAAPLLVAALAGLAMLVATLGLGALALWRGSVARRVGSLLGAVVSRVRRLVGRAPVEGWGEAAVAFRARALSLLARRWPALTLSTVASHLTLYAVFLVSIRVVGIGADEVGWAEALGVFAFARLIAALPVTPGGLGLIELGYVGALVLAGGTGVSSRAVAGVLVFRTLTYALQIPLGGLTYAMWRRMRSWRTRPSRAVATRSERVGG